MLHIQLLITILLSLTVFTSHSHADSNSCPSWQDHDFRQLHSDNTFNLCDVHTGKALLIVNTASHCGFTPQFGALEALYQRYQHLGLTVIGFASDDFNQAAATEEIAATVCYENFGVSFTMAAPISVKGQNAHPLFRQLAQATEEPHWNFNKYLVSKDGKAIEHFGSVVSPDDRVLNEKIAALLN